MSTSTLEGIRCRSEGYIAKCRTAWPFGRDSIESTLPTWTPCIFTFASTFITRPARDEITVTGTLSVKLPWNKPTATATIATRTATVTRPVSARIPLWGMAFSLSREVEVSVRSVDRERNEQRYRHHDDEGCAYGVTGGDPDALGSAAGEISVVRVQKQHGKGHQNRLQERPDQVDRVQEGVEVVLIQAA